jgi:hypothetical protein
LVINAPESPKIVLQTGGLNGIHLPIELATQLDSGSIPGKELIVVQELLRDFAGVFRKELPWGIPPSRGASHRVTLKSDAKPFFGTLYRQSLLEKKTVDKIIDELLDTGKITKSNSSWGAPILLVRKRTDN